MTTKDFIDYHANHKAMFDVSRTEANKYYDLEKSFEVVNMLLIFQFGSRDKIREFLQNMLDVLDKRTTKQNCVMIIGPRESGKSYLMDCILAFYLSIGYMNNPSRTNSFPFNMCVDKRALLWNEPNFEPGFEETLKKVTGGDSESVNVKYRNHEHLGRTPIFITTNTVILQSDIFNQRIRRVYFTSCNPLKGYDKYPTPLVWGKLIEFYSLDLYLPE